MNTAYGRDPFRRILPYLCQELDPERFDTLIFLAGCLCNEKYICFFIDIKPRENEMLGQT